MKNTVWLVAVTLVLTSCAPANNGEITLSSECASALSALEKVPLSDFEAEALAITESTKACTSPYEYILGVKANPAAWAYTSADKIQEDLLIQSACQDNIAQIMCLTAELEGRLK